ERTLCALCERKVFPSAPHLIAHQNRVAARRLELDAALVRERDTGDFAEKCSDAPALRFCHTLRDARPEFLAAFGGGLAVLDPRGPPTRPAPRGGPRNRAHPTAA